MRFYKTSWFQILFFGLILFIITEKTMIYTKNIVFLPTVIVLGSFLIPVVFVLYIYEKTPKNRISFRLFLYSFLVGGLLGVIAAGILEYEIFRALGFLPMFLVGMAEESAKLIFPLIIYLFWRKRSRFNGIVLGVASGMGFAAMETMGYALYNIISYKSTNLLLDILLIRGLISPFGHAAWTGYLCFILWSEKPSIKRFFKKDIIKAFFMVIVLHTLWNTTHVLKTDSMSILGFNILSITIALVSLFLLIESIRTAKAED